MTTPTDGQLSRAGITLPTTRWQEIDQQAEEDHALRGWTTTAATVAELLRCGATSTDQLLAAAPSEFVMGGVQRSSGSTTLTLSCGTVLDRRSDDMYVWHHIFGAVGILWRPWQNHGNGVWSVSADGAVRQIRRTRTSVEGWDCQRRRYWGTYAVQMPDRSLMQVAVMVLEAFKEPRPDRHTVHFKNGNRFDCRLENLEWQAPTHAVRVKPPGYWSKIV